MTLQQATQRSAEASRGEQIQRDDRKRKDDTDEALGEDVEGDGGIEGPAEQAGWLILSFGEEEGVEREREQHADQHVGNVDAREDEDAEAGQRDQRGVEAGSGVEGSTRPAFHQQRESEDRER